MKSLIVGRNTSEAEVQNVSRFGVWLHVKGQEYFLPFKKFPWFHKAKVSDVYDLQFHHGKHLYWPKLDIDLELESLENPAKYPLEYQ